VSRALLAPLAALAAALLLAGCNAGGNEQDAPRDVPPLTLVHILPTPNGLTDVGSARAAGPAVVQAALAGRPDAPSVKNLEESGLGAAAIRRWRGRDGATFTVVVSRWSNHEAATNVGGDAAELPLGSPGATAWTPDQIGGSRGSKVDPPGPRSRALSYAVGYTELFVRSTGGVPDDDVVKTMQRMIAALGAGEPPKGG
jgi:hypothetical protein